MMPKNYDHISKQYIELVQILEQLRGAEGCPWDLKQTHESLVSYLLEETYEVIDAIERKNNADLAEELGDLLLQIVFHAQIASERNDFDLGDVAQKINEKMKRRHPHVFSNQKMTEEEVRLNWEKTKAEERKAQNKASLLSNLPASLPALQKAYQIGKKVSQVGFDWKKTEDVILKIKEELQELSEALEKKEQDSITEEMGDVLFSIANLCRFISVNPEEALRKTCQKFIDRFQWMERSLDSQKESFKNKSLEELDLLWDEAKKSTKAVQKL